MEFSDFFHKIKVLNKNKKNLHHSSSMNSISINRNYNLNSKTESKSIKISDKKYKYFSRSSLGLIKRPKNNNQNNELNILYNNFTYKNSNYIAPKYNHYLHLNSFKKNYSGSNTIENKQNIYPNIYLNKTRNVFKDNSNNINLNSYNNYSNRKINRSKSQDGSTGDMATFYSLNKSPYSNFILDKKIKIFNDTKSKTFRSKYILDKNNNKITINGFKRNNTKKKSLYNKLMPSDLNIFKEKLFNESKVKKHLSSKSQEYIPHIKDIDNLPNSKDNFNNKNKTKIDEEKNYENIEFNGTLMKVVTKLTTEKNINNNNNDFDYHKIMQHPFMNESFGYDFLRNIKSGYKIYKNPFDDKDLIFYIHNLIINPNTKKFRNDNLIIGSEFYKRKDKNEKEINYKLLSKIGFKRMQNSIMKNLKKDVAKGALHMKKIKDDLDILMKNKLKKFREHRDNLIHDEI